jgi:hypothetical protein
MQVERKGMFNDAADSQDPDSRQGDWMITHRTGNDVELSSHCMI